VVSMSPFTKGKVKLVYSVACVASPKQWLVVATTDNVHSEDDEQLLLVHACHPHRRTGNL